MAITVAILRAAGLSSDQIIRVLELEQSERMAHERERKRVYRRKNSNKNNVRVVECPGTDGTDGTDGTILSPIKKEKNQKKEINPSPLLVSSSNELATRRGQQRGYRLPDNWMPSEVDGEFAVARIGRERSQTEFEKFCDYWHARAGPNGVKLDWSATWRNWIRKASENGQTSKRNGSILDAIDRVLAEEEAGGSASAAGLFRLPPR